ncbi:winged helix-turn-helix domain-containing protein [uncultured Shewanella sp.]|uniref:winged helix-turn-helix domain-containing protein n=1 Tax=uncultured Shewanella sp. TaxID=173975 RepID=UPI00260A6FD5|nr:winged helix-turn-helix domain-containing protein [uncultured Shewanella sp.]
MQEECNRVQLGDFTLDLKQQVLYLDEFELSVEPKVLELLLYLYQCRQGYVTLKALHENVWSDRVVSDTAVRSAIKKLRTLFNDTDLNAPKYIKSVPKRGYKLICSVKLSPKQTPSQISLNRSETLKQAVIITQAQKRQWQFGHYVALSLVLLMISLSIIGAKQLIDNNLVPENEIALISVSSFPGEKLTLEVSSDDSLIAFTGKLASEQDNQVYLLDKQSGHVDQLTYDANNATFLTFAGNNTQVIYSDLIAGNSSLRNVSLKKRGVTSTTLMAGFHFIGDVHIGSHEREVIVLLSKTANDTPMYYRLNLDTLGLDLLLSTNNTGEEFSMAKLSPDKQKIAAIKELNNKQVELSVIDLASKKLVFQKMLPHITPPIDWKSNTELLLLYPNQLVLLDLNNQTEKVILNDDKSRFSWLSVGSNKLTLLQQDLSRQNRFYVEENINFTDSCNEPCQPSHFLDMGSEVYSVFYADKQHKWITSKIEGQNELALYDDQTGKKSVFFTGNEEIEIQHFSPHDSTLLVKLANRLAILTLNDEASSEQGGAEYGVLRSTIRYLTAQHQVVSDAVFSVFEKERHVFYGERIGGRWQIQKLNLSTMKVELFMADYRSIRITNKDYILANGSGWLFSMSKDNNSITPLNEQINFDIITRWYVKGSKVIWSDFDYRFSYIHTFDLLSKQHKTRQDRFYHLFPRISLSSLDDKLIYRSKSIQNNEIKEVIF